MSRDLTRLRVALCAGQAVPPDVARKLLEWLSESPMVIEERNRLIAHHAHRLGGGKLYTGCQRLLVMLKANHPSVSDLANLGCPMPDLRQVYRVARKFADTHDSLAK